MEREMWFGVGGDLSFETGLPVEPLAAGFAAPARSVHLQARPLVLTIHRIEPHRSGHDINIVGVFWQINCDLNAQTMSKEVF